MGFWTEETFFQMAYILNPQDPQKSEFMPKNLTSATTSHSHVGSSDLRLPLAAWLEYLVKACVSLDRKPEPTYQVFLSRSHLLMIMSDSSG